MDKLIVCNRAIVFKDDMAFLAQRESGAPVTPLIASEFSRLRADAVEAFRDDPSIVDTPALHAGKTTFAEARFVAAALAGIVETLMRHEFERSIISSRT